MDREVVVLAAIFVFAIVAIVGLQLIISALNPLNVITIAIGFGLLLLGAGIIYYVVKESL